MEYRVEELARRADLRVDTVRYYQSKGLLAAPRREGRVAWYDDAHLERLQRIRALRDDGLSLEWIRRVLDRDTDAADAPLLEALVQEQAGSRSLTRDELATAAGIPPSLVQAAETAGLIRPLEVDGEPRFGEADLEMLSAGLEVLAGGFRCPSCSPSPSITLVPSTRPSIARSTCSTIMSARPSDRATTTPAPSPTRSRRCSRT